jgi:hypothetical protein
MSMTLRIASLCWLVCCAVSVSEAAITYVDAIPNTNGSDGNTTLNGNLIDLAADTTTGSNATDGKWAYRAITATNNANGPAFWESDTSAGDGETTLPLVTTLTGLTPGQKYNIYAVFWGDTNFGTIAPNWDIATRTSSTGPFTLYKTTTAPYVDLGGLIDGGIATLSTVDGSEFTNAGIKTRAGNVPPNLQLYYANLGTFTIDNTGTFSVWIDGPDVDNGSNGAKRTWYDGLGFEAVPEPSSLILVGVGVTFLARRRAFLARRRSA